MEALERVTHEFTYESGPSRVGQTIGHSPRLLQMYRAGHGGLSLYRRHKADDASGKTGGAPCLVVLPLYLRAREGRERSRRNFCSRRLASSLAMEGDRRPVLGAHAHTLFPPLLSL